MGCGGDPHAQAHKRVLNEFEQIWARGEEAAETKNIPEYKRAVLQVYSEASRISLCGCSPEFRRDFVDLINALGEFYQAVDAMPDGHFDAIIRVLSNAVRGELDGGVSRMENNLIRARARLMTARAEMKKYE